MFITNPLTKNILYIYLPTKILIISLMIYLFPVFFEKNYFSDNDFQNIYSKCLDNSFNLFFSKMVCFFEIKNLSDFKAICFAFLINFVKDFIFLFIAHKKFSKNLFILFLFILSLHPYLNSHYVKFSTILFANLAVALIFFEIEISKKKSIFLNLVLIILTGFRNGIFFLILLYQLVHSYNFLIKLKSNIIRIIFVFFLISILLVVFLNFFNLNYLIKFITDTKKYSLNFFYFDDFLSFINLDFIRIIFSIILLFFSHLIMLLGFREKAFTEFESYFFSVSYSSYFEITISILLFIFHLFGLFYFFKLSNKKEYYIVYFISLLPFLFLVSHLRYFMPYIPLAAFGFCMYFNLKTLNNKNK